MGYEGSIECSYVVKGGFSINMEGHFHSKEYFPKIIIQLLLNTAKDFIIGVVNMDHLGEYNKNPLSRMIDGQRKAAIHFMRNMEPPYDSIKEEDTLYMSTRGGITVAKATVEKVENFKDLDPRTAKDIIMEHKNDIAPTNMMMERDIYRKYLTIIWLDNVQEMPPFTVSPQ